MIEQRLAFNAAVIHIEDKASGTHLIQELSEGQYGITRYQAKMDKAMRMHIERRSRWKRRYLALRPRSWPLEVEHLFRAVALVTLVLRSGRASEKSWISNP